MLEKNLCLKDSVGKEKKVKYEVQTKFVYSGTFTVEADSAPKAKELVQNYCWMDRGKAYSNLMDDGTDWEFCMNPDIITGKVRKIKP